jgi:hypothetical protein
LRFAPAWLRPRVWRIKTIRQLSFQGKRRTPLRSRTRYKCALINTTLRVYSRVDGVLRQTECYMPQTLDTDSEKTGFKDEAALDKTHKSIDLKYLQQLNRMAVRLLHDSVLEPSSKVDTTTQSKLNGILRNSEVSQIRRVAVNDDDEKWSAQPWKIPGSSTKMTKSLGRFSRRPVWSPRLILIGTHLMRSTRYTRLLSVTCLKHLKLICF